MPIFLRWLLIGTDGLWRGKSDSFSAVCSPSSFEALRVMVTLINLGGNVVLVEVHFYTCFIVVFFKIAQLITFNTESLYIHTYYCIKYL